MSNEMKNVSGPLNLVIYRPVVQMEVYWGTTTTVIMTENDIKNDIDGTDMSLSINRDIIFNCTGGQYFYYAYPDSWGLVDNINTKVNGLSFSSWSDNNNGSSVEGFNINITDVYGALTSYRVYKCYYLQHGSSIPVNFRK